MIRKLKTLRKLPPRERLFVLEIFATLCLGWLSEKFLPSKMLVRIYGRQMVETPARLPEEQEEFARHTGTTLAFVKKHLLWRSTCVMDAIAARIILKRRNIPSTVYIGFRHGVTSGPFNAHAWVRSGKWTVTGSPVHKTYRVGVYYGNLCRGPGDHESEISV
jgi:hypothetical protein